jgi:hypothetical protein
MSVTLDALSSNPNDAVNAMKAYGSFWLRNAIDCEELDHLHIKATEFFEIANKEGAEGVARLTALPTANISGHAEGAKERGVVHHSVLSWAMFHRPDGLETTFASMIADERVFRFIQPIIGECVLHTPNLAIRYRNRPELALPFHQDGAYYDSAVLGDWVTMLVIWVPFTDCNEDAPGLEIVPQNLSTCIGIRKQPRSRFGHLEADVPDDLPVWYPHTKRGDCLVFAERTLHRSRPGEVRIPRTSVDIRVFARDHIPQALSGHAGLNLPSLERVTMTPAVV